MNLNNQSNRIDRLGEIQDGLEYLIDKPKVSIYEMMNDRFIRANTDFKTFENLLFEAGVLSEEDLETPSFVNFIKTHTRFEDWEEMLVVAGNQYVRRHLVN